MNLPGVPETITRSALDALIASLGVDGDRLISLSIGHASIEAVVLAVGPDGHPYRSPDSAHIAQHRISIPVVD